MIPSAQLRSKNTSHTCRALSKPFNKRAATDDFKLEGNIVNILASIGKAFDPSFPNVLRVAAAQVSQ